MPLVAREVLLVNQEIMVCVELPEATVEHVEVLIGKVLSHLVDVLFRCHVEEHVLQVRTLEVSERDLPVIVDVYLVEDAHDHGVSVAVLELRRRLQELQAWVALEKSLHHWLEVFSHDRIRAVGFSYDPEDALRDIKVLELSAPEELKRWLGNLACLPSVYAIEKHALQELRQAANFGSDGLEVFFLHLNLIREELVYGLFCSLEMVFLPWLALWEVEPRDVRLLGLWRFRCWVRLHLNGSGDRTLFLEGLLLHQLSHFICISLRELVHVATLAVLGARAAVRRGIDQVIRAQCRFWLEQQRCLLRAQRPPHELLARGRARRGLSLGRHLMSLDLGDKDRRGRRR